MFEIEPRKQSGINWKSISNRIFMTFFMAKILLQIVWGNIIQIPIGLTLEIK